MNRNAIMGASLVLLALATTGWAGELDRKIVFTEAGGQFRMPAQWDGGTLDMQCRWVQRPDLPVCTIVYKINTEKPGLLDCLATMETAMKAMEPYFQQWRYEGYHDEGAWVMRAQESQFHIHNLSTLWAEAKRCWRTP